LYENRLFEIKDFVVVVVVEKPLEDYKDKKIIITQIA
jgi:hypothetical protein